MYMISYLYEQFAYSRAVKAVVYFFVLLSVWWLTIFIRGLVDQPENTYFVFVYPIVALIGGAIGGFFSQKWGGFKSVLGRSIALFSLGIFCQFGGQILYNYYTFVLGVEVPYPSIGDYVYFASVIFYIFGVISLAKVSGLKLTMKTMRGKVLAFGIPVIMLLVSYVILLSDYEVDLSNKALLFFDFGFPIGQVIYVSIALTALFISKDILGGMMRKPIMLLISALIFQYIADFVFSYQFSQGTLYVGGFMDYLYCVSYFLMALALFSIGNMFYRVKES